MWKPVANIDIYYIVPGILRGGNQHMGENLNKTYFIQSLPVWYCTIKITHSDGVHD